ncbi:MULTISPECIES: alpha/beta fold hydrolase [Nocardiopsis]|uniref:Alpha/beta fold hydrolase n=1 Tax=Nocardiopsis changdeensis TaxID=2831969 RepID=A0ABX8BUR9_9ACTN|nr:MULTISPECIES: alpha/beta fold hydrolase [Nocardiopsis]QUX25985.1 alpha/beta fold hydrolase [Nocardiopsis changdeensis]QYX40460.1 alpha/beta fold hydrolase [Nocardiopsis sp. MT53]
MGVPIVLVHGLRVSGSMWRPQVDLLTEQGRRVVAPDLPGHGSRRGEDFSLGRAVDAVVEAIDGVGGRALVVGLSLGGFVSIATAAAAPGKVAGLVAASCTAKPAQALAQVYRIPAVLMDRLPDKGATLNERFHRLTLRDTAAEAVLDGGLAVEAATAVIDAVAEMDALAALERYPGPVWLVNGARDHFRLHERQFFEACAEGRLLNVPRAGHMVSLDQPVDFTRIVSDAADVVWVRENAAAREGRSLESDLKSD